MTDDEWATDIIREYLDDNDDMAVWIAENGPLKEAILSAFASIRREEREKLGASADADRAVVNEAPSGLRPDGLPSLARAEQDNDEQMANDIVCLTYGDLAKKSPITPQGLKNLIVAALTARSNRINDLEVALKPFADEGERLLADGSFDDPEIFDGEDFPVESQEMSEAGACADIMLSDLRRARDLLRESDQSPKGGDLLGSVHAGAVLEEHSPNLRSRTPTEAPDHD
jgi:hypothetical protein